MLHSSLVMNNIRNGQQVPESAAVSGSTESFCYHDRLLPPGWYVKIDKKQVAENSRLHSFSQDPITVEDQYTDFYYKHFGETFGHQPPEPDKLMPWRDQLSEINQQLAPTFTLASRQASASRNPIMESGAATTELLEMQRKCEALEEENRKLGSFRKSKMDPFLRVELSCWC